MSLSIQALRQPPLLNTPEQSASSSNTENVSILENTPLSLLFSNLLSSKSPRLSIEAIDIIASYSPDLFCARKANAILLEVFDTFMSEPVTRTKPLDGLAMYRGHELELLTDDLWKWHNQGISGVFLECPHGRWSTRQPTIEETQTIGTHDSKRFEPITIVDDLRQLFKRLDKKQLSLVITFLKTYCPNLRSLDLSGSKIEREHLLLLAGFKNLKILKLANTTIVDADLASLSNMALEELDLSSTSITGSCFQWFKKSLKVLTLQFCKQLDFTKLYQFQDSILQKLDLSYTSVTDQVPAQLPPSLVELKLIDCPQISDAVVLQLTHTHLRALDLSRNDGIKGQHFDKIPNSLKVLNVSQCRRLTDEQLCKLLNTQIEELDASTTTLRGSCFTFLPRGLKKINLTSTMVTDYFFSDLPKGLEELILRWTFIDNRAIAALHDMERLSNLTIDSCQEITDLTGLPQSIKKLSARYCQGLLDTGLKPLVHLQLRELDLTWTHITGEGLQNLDVQKLVLDGCQKLTDETLGKIRCANLRQLNIAGCANIVDHNSSNIHALLARQCIVTPLMINSLY